ASRFRHHRTRKAGEKRADIVVLRELGLVDLADERAFPGDGNDEPGLLERAPRFPDRPAADAECLRERLLIEAFTGFHLATEDPVLQLLVDDLRQRLATRRCDRGDGIRGRALRSHEANGSGFNTEVNGRRWPFAL